MMVRRIGVCLMSLLAVPLYLLYELGLLVMRLSYKKRAEKAV